MNRAESPTRRHERWLAIAIVVACVLFRSAPSVRWRLMFDSDEAIVGLMAKHIVRPCENGSRLAEDLHLCRPTP